MVGIPPKVFFFWVGGLQFAPDTDKTHSEVKPLGRRSLAEKLLDWCNQDQ